MKNSLNTPVVFPSGATMKNRFMLAPMTNTQSMEDGTLSEAEFKWLTMRAEGQFGLVMTCAAHVQKNGKGFPGQLGLFAEEHSVGHKRLASRIKSQGSLAVVQLHHAGMRSPFHLIDGVPVCPSKNEKHGARALDLAEIVALKNNFITAAIRAKKWGYDGVEVHGAHGYILTQFLSAEINVRTDNYGGSLENRARLLFEIVNGIREACGNDFIIGVRLSPEKFGMTLKDTKAICKRFILENKIDFLDISLWDVFKFPEEETDKTKTLLSHFTTLDFNNILLTVAGKIRNAEDVKKVLAAGVDFVSIGRSAILHHDFPKQVMENPQFQPTQTPVSKAYLKKEGLSDNFIEYMKRWPDFVESDT